jgi:cobyrinic acid a,c-diamide synthase
MKAAFPRLVIAGTAGDSGKTMLSMGLLAAWREGGVALRAFKKGPDYIDPAWLSLAAGTSCYNLDTFMQPSARLLGAFLKHASPEMNIIEGNRGYLDGVDADGTHSTASLARLLAAPVILIVSAKKVTRTVAAMVFGCQQLSPEAPLRGVILNRVAGARHETLVRQAVERLTGVAVIGALPEHKENWLPDRHLGLVPPQEHERAQEILGSLAGFIGRHVQLDRLMEIARDAAPIASPAAVAGVEAQRPSVRPRIGVFSDAAFTFYYPDNLEALEEAGAELIFISALADRSLPVVDALYLGGGFPETHAAELSRNTSLQQEVRAVADEGMPIYAECGGMIYLAQTLRWAGQTYPLAGVLPLQLELLAKPQGHGYMEVEVDHPNPFFAVGTSLVGHEFHYSRVLTEGAALPTAFAVRRGTGCGGGRDGIIYKNVLAGYMHLHALGAPAWAGALVSSAVNFRNQGAAGRSKQG